MTSLKIKDTRKSLNLTQSDVAKYIGVTKATVSQWENGDTSPNGKNLIRLLKLFKMNYDTLKGTVSETRDPLSTYVRDHDYNSQTVKHLMSAQELSQGAIPLVSWVAAGCFCENNDPFPVGAAEEYYPCATKHSKSTFALRVEGLSMYPKFSPGDIIYVDPEREAVNGSYVIVRQDDDTKATFKQLRIMGNEKYLEAINKSIPGMQDLIEMMPDANVCGVVIAKHEVFI